MTQKHQQMSDLDWPAGYERTPPDERTDYPGTLTVTYRDAFTSIVEELERWGATSVDVEVAGPTYVNNSNIPHKSKDADDPGVVAYFRREDEAADAGYAIACDRYNTQYENARAIALYVRRKRLAERCGVTTAEAEFQTARLPPGDDDAIAVEPETDAPHEVLGVAPDAPEEVVEAAARRLKATNHPDSGGSPEEFQHVVEAEEAMLE